MQKAIRFTGDSHNGIYIEETNNTGVFVPITLDNALTAFEILRLKINGDKEKLLNFKSMLPNNIIKYSQSDSVRDVMMIWWTKPIKKYLSHIKKESCGIVYYPATIFFYDKNELYLYAIKDKEPTLETKLYKFPFPNIYGGGDLCFGSVKKEEIISLEKLIDDMEYSVFGTKYSHGLNTAPMKSDKPELIFKAMASGKRKTFPKSELLPTGKILKDIIW